MDPQRTRDSVEQIEDAEMTNPITDRDATLTEPGEGFEPGTDTTPDDPEEEGPPAHTSQVAR